MRAVSKFTWQLLHKYSLSLHLIDLLSPVKSLEGEQLTVLVFYARVQYAHIGRTKKLKFTSISGSIPGPARNALPKFLLVGRKTIINCDKLLPSQTLRSIMSKQLSRPALIPEKTMLHCK